MVWVGRDLKDDFIAIPLPWGRHTFHYPRAFQGPPNLALDTPRGSARLPWLTIHQAIDSVTPTHKLSLASEARWLNWSFHATLLLPLYLLRCRCPLNRACRRQTLLLSCRKRLRCRCRLQAAWMSMAALFLCRAILTQRERQHACKERRWSEGGLPQGGRAAWHTLVGCLFVVRKRRQFSKVPVEQRLPAAAWESVSFPKPSWASSEGGWFSWSLLCVVYPVVSAVQPLS